MAAGERWPQTPGRSSRPTPRSTPTRGDAAPVGAVVERLGALWQVASTQDGWVQLRTRVAPSHLCAVGAPAEGEADLTVWTPLTSLQRAVTRAVVVAPNGHHG